MKNESTKYLLFNDMVMSGMKCFAVRTKNKKIASFSAKVIQNLAHCSNTMVVYFMDERMFLLT